MIKWFKSLFSKPENKFRKYGSNLKCLKCEAWSHDVEGIKSLRYDEKDNTIIFTTCKKCGEESEWYTGAPMYIPMDEMRGQTKEKEKEIKENKMKVVELDKGVQNTFNDICMYHSVKEPLRQAIYQMLLKDQELKDRLRDRVEFEMNRADTAEETIEGIKSQYLYNFENEGSNNVTSED